MNAPYDADGYSSLNQIRQAEGAIVISRRLADQREVTIRVELTPQTAQILSQNFNDMISTLLLIDLVKSKDIRENFTVTFSENEIHNAVEVWKSKLK